LLARYDDADQLSFQIHQSENESAATMHSSSSGGEPTKVVIAVENTNLSKNNDFIYPPLTPNTKPNQLSPPPSTKSLSGNLLRSFNFDPLGTNNNALHSTAASPMTAKDISSKSFKGSEELSTKTLLNDAIKGRALVDTSLPLETRIYKVTKGKLLFS